MTPQRAKELLPIFTAFANGEAIQFKSPSGSWQDSLSHKLSFNCEKFEYRVKPVSRPWSKPEDVPGPVCWVRKAGLEGFASLVIGVTPYGCRFIRSDDEPISRVDWEDFEEREHSTDRKTWLPCTVPEEQP